MSVLWSIVFNAIGLIEGIVLVRFCQGFAQEPPKPPRRSALTPHTGLTIKNLEEMVDSRMGGSKCQD